jgi:hypothetical protein
MAKTYTYEDFEKALAASGLGGQFSEADLRLARQNPDAGMSILTYKQDYNNATTDEARALANAGANSDVSVGRVESNQIYEVASPGNVTVGTEYTLDSYAQGITTTTTSGVAEVVYADSRVAHIRFS